MPNPPNKLNVNIVFERDLKDKFDRIYSKQLFKIFIQRCVERAVLSKDFFDDVFFNSQEVY